MIQKPTLADKRYMEGSVKNAIRLIETNIYRAADRTPTQSQYYQSRKETLLKRLEEVETMMDATINDMKVA